MQKTRRNLSNVKPDKKNLKSYDLNFKPIIL